MQSLNNRWLPIVGGVAGARLGFALLFWVVSYFVPRSLRAAGDGRVRFILIVAMAVIVLLNVFQRYRRRRTMPNRQEKARAARNTPGGV